MVARIHRVGLYGSDSDDAAELSAEIHSVAGGVARACAANRFETIDADFTEQLRSPSCGGFGVISVGQTWNFQCWYRDAASPCGITNKLSNGLSVDFIT